MERDRERPGRVPPRHRPEGLQSINENSSNLNSASRLGVENGYKPTFYNNVPFPTELEARWARFFDLLRVRWVFNPRIDQLGRALPFWLAFTEEIQSHYRQGIPEERGLWVAISPSEPDAATKLRCRNLASQSNHWVHLLVGEPQPGFCVWSWRLSQRITIDGRHNVADFELYHAGSPKTAGFVVDFAFNTIDCDGGDDGDRPFIERAFQAMGS
jgi:hypothetical protein